MSEHTKGPWRTGYRYPCRIISYVGNIPASTCLPEDEGTESDEQKANAARIVACVNACEGINPEAVPDAMEALRNIAIAPCLYAMLGDEPEQPCGCPGCRARAAIERATR